MATKEEMGQVLGRQISDKEAEFIKQYYSGFATNPGNYQGSSLIKLIRNDLELHSDFIAGNYQTTDNKPIKKNKQVTLSLYDAVKAPK